VGAVPNTNTAPSPVHKKRPRATSNASKDFTGQTKTALILFATASLFAVVLHLVQILKNARNVPIADDFVLIKYLLSLEGVGQFLVATFSYHNEHLIVANRLLALLSYQLLGSLDFRFLIYIGNLALLGAIVLLASSRQRSFAERWVSGGFIALVVLQPQHAQAVLWATPAVALLVSFFVLTLCLRLLESTSGAAYVLAWAISALAVLIQGNGLFVPLVAAIVLLRSKRLVLSLPLVLTFFALCAILYGSDVGESRFEFSIFLHYFARFLGAAAAFEQPLVAELIGWTVSLILALCFFSKVSRERQLLFGMLLFCVLTAAANALLRHSHGLDVGFQVSRYRLVSAFAIAVSLALVTELLFSRTARAYTLLTAGVLFSLTTNYRYGHYYQAMDQIAFDSALRWELSISGVYHPSEQAMNQQLLRAEQRGFYKAPAYIAQIQPAVPIQTALPKPAKRIINNFLQFAMTETFIMMDGWTFIKGMEMLDPKTSVVFRRENGDHYTFPATIRIRPDVTAHHRQGNLDQSGYFLLLDRHSLPPGRYVRAILIEQNGQSEMRYFGPELELGNSS